MRIDHSFWLPAFPGSPINGRSSPKLQADTAVEGQSLTTTTRASISTTRTRRSTPSRAALCHPCTTACCAHSLRDSLRIFGSSSKSVTSVKAPISSALPFDHVLCPVSPEHRSKPPFSIHQHHFSHPIVRTTASATTSAPNHHRDAGKRRAVYDPTARRCTKHRTERNRPRATPGLRSRQQVLGP